MLKTVNRLKNKKSGRLKNKQVVCVNVGCIGYLHWVERVGPPHEVVQCHEAQRRDGSAQLPRGWMRVDESASGKKTKRTDQRRNIFNMELKA